MPRPVPSSRGGPAGEPLVSRAALVVGLMLIVVPLSGLINAWPFQVGDLEWRFRQFGVFAGSLPPTVLGLAICMYTARALAYGRLQLVVGLASLAGAATLLVLTLSFGLDGVSVASIVASEEQGVLRRAVVRVGLQAVAVSLALIALGTSSVLWRRREVRARRRAEQASEAPSKIVSMSRPAQMSTGEA